MIHQKRVPYAMILAFLTGSATGALILSALLRPQPFSGSLENNWPLQSKRNTDKLYSPFPRSNIQQSNQNESKADTQNRNLRGTSTTENSASQNLAHRRANDQKISFQEEQIAALQDQLRQVQMIEASKLQSAMAEMQDERRILRENIAIIEAQMKNMDLSLPQEQQTASIEESRENMIFQQVLNDLQQRIQTQKQTIHTLQQQMSGLVAPTGSDVQAQIEKQLSQANNSLVVLETQYQNTIQNREAALAKQTELWTNRQSRQEAGRVDLQITLENARSELESIQNRIAQITNMQAQNEKLQLDLKNEIIKKQQELASARVIEDNST
jgi:hypothetical protein